MTHERALQEWIPSAVTSRMHSAVSDEERKRQSVERFRDAAVAADGAGNICLEEFIGAFGKVGSRMSCDSPERIFQESVDRSGLIDLQEFKALWEAWGTRTSFADET